MRIHLDNKTQESDSLIMALLKVAAHVVPSSGIVRVTVRYKKNRECMTWGGWCKFWEREILITLPKRQHFQPTTLTTLGYFRQHNIPLRKPIEMRIWEDVLVKVAAHEFGHLKPRGQQKRKSLMELYCQECAANALEFFRSEEGQAMFNRERAGIIADETARIERKAADVAYARSDEAKLVKLLAAQKRWTTKRKRAETALKKLARQIRNIERRAN